MTRLLRIVVKNYSVRFLNDEVLKMKKIRIMLIAFLSGFFAIPSAHSQLFPSSLNDGNDLIVSCELVLDGAQGKKVTNPMAAGWCLGVVSGVRDIISGFTAGGHIPSELGVCLPSSGINNGQAIRVVKKYLDNNPQNLHIPASFLVAYALRSAYPCN
ncbi:MAG: Rap1a/Tai family immunity protein [Halomonas sp.]|uniref:Rap1a/Tai family immunity protein n=1 Tax=Halomonas sp. TaxID=1486246 RepID=UPI002ACE2EE1|nr:Rap1a/Tai family immunity protein [Halomonas sp.]MDZ7853505.1 Rap1a/Tai family immunity protein [Halomonas sp.]